MSHFKAGFNSRTLNSHSVYVDVQLDVVFAEYDPARVGQGGAGSGNLRSSGALLILHRALPAGGTGPACHLHRVENQVPSHLGGTSHSTPAVRDWLTSSVS